VESDGEGRKERKRAEGARKRMERVRDQGREGRESEGGRERGRERGREEYCPFFGGENQVDINS
jgi:hypothetical protein